MSAFFGAGATQAASNVLQYEDGRAMRDTQLAQAKLQQKSAQATFDENQAMAPMRKEGAALELQQLKNQVNTQNQSQVQQMAVDGISRFKADGDVRHLNTWMDRAKANPLGQKLHGDVARFDKLTKSPQNDRLLREAGIENADEVYNNPEAFPSLVLVTRTDGTQAVGDMNTIGAQVGYDKYMSAEDLATRERESIVTARLRQGTTVNASTQTDKVIKSMMENDPNLTYSEAYEQVKSMGKNSNLSGDQAGIKGVQEENPGMSYLDAAEQWFALKKAGGSGGSDRDKFLTDFMNENSGSTRMDAQNAYDKRVPTSTQKELGSVDEAKDALDDMNFFDIDMSKATPKERADIHRYVGKIEDLRGIKLSNEDKRVMRDFSSLVSLAGEVGENLTEEQTGLVDNMFSTAKGYLFNEVGGKPAKAAYQTFTNIMLKTMSGAAVSDQEMTRMVKAAGSANLQLKPLLAAFRTQVKTIKTQLESIRDTNDPHLAQYYLGKDLNEVDDVIRGLDARLGDMSRAGAAAGPKSKEETATTLGEEIKAQTPAIEPKGKVDFDALWKEVN